MKIGIIGAMNEEISLLHDIITVEKENIFAGRHFYSGKINDSEAVLVQAKIGKIAAAITTSLLLTKYNVDAVIFTGVAGAVSDELNIGDITIANSLMQHDMDASPIFPKYQIPLLDISSINTSPDLTNKLKKASYEFVQNNLHQAIPQHLLYELAIKAPKIVPGTIVSGDQFIKDKDVITRIKKDIPDAKCVEMEGAAVAQVCYEFKKPFAIMRVISDKADHSAKIDFPKFLQVASHYSKGIIGNLFKSSNILS